MDFIGAAVLALWIALSLSACRVYDGDLIAGMRSNTARADGVSGLEEQPGDASVQDGSVDGQDGSDSGSPAGSGCTSGECWWSTGSASPDSATCRSAGVPSQSDRPAARESAVDTQPDIYLGFTRVWFAGSGGSSNASWQQLGFDLDGRCTNSSSCGDPGVAGCHSLGPEVPFDGTLCRDNAFGRLQPVLRSAPGLTEQFGLSEESFNCQLWRGGYNMIVRLSGYNGEPDDPDVRVDYYMSTGLDDANATTWTCPADDFSTRYPRWRSWRSWKVDDSALTGPIADSGTLPDSKFADAAAYVRGGYLVASIPDGTPQGFMGTPDGYRGLVFTAHGGLYVGRLAQSQDAIWELSDGLLGGRLRKDELVSAYREAGFCETGDVNTFYNIVVDFIDHTADIRADGAVDPSVDCDALSYAIGFEGSQLRPGAAVTVAPRTECCAPGKPAEACAARCGDGTVDGEELCDIAIPTGQPGACTTTCPLAADCSPQLPSGTGCAIKCMPSGPATLGADDGCCPPGGNLATDKDCAVRCGNGVIEAGETCDPQGTCMPCVSPSSCFTVKTLGSAETCDLRCELAPVMECKAGDGCCPEACDSGSDNDCSRSCMNRRLDDGETCERGTDKPCESDCDDKDPCTVDQRAGDDDTCSVVCAHTQIRQALTGDACCPSGVSSNADGECGASCGNRFVEIGEECDDGNTADGDGCSGCKKENQQSSCASVMGENDCARCTCDNCAGQAIDCYTHTDPAEAALCGQLVDCQYDSGCHNPDCFCGKADLLMCLGGMSDGACKQQTIAAAKTDSILDINIRSSDIKYPLGRANVLFTCVQRFCPNVCK